MPDQNRISKSGSQVECGIALVVRHQHLIAAMLPFFYMAILPIYPRLIPNGFVWVGLYDWQRVGQMVALIMAVLMTLSLSRTAFERWLPRREVCFAFFIIAWGSTSLWVNATVDFVGLRELACVMLLIGAFWLIRFGLLNALGIEWQRGILFLFVASAFLYVAAFFGRNWDYMIDPEFVRDGVTLPAFANVRFFSDYQALLMPFVICAVSLGRTSLERVSAWLLVALFAMLFYYSGSRVVVLGQIGAHISLALLIGRAYLPVLRRHALAWGGGYLLFIVFSVVVPLIIIPAGNSTTVSVMPLVRNDLSLREVLWSIAWQDMMSHPWFGVGPGGFSRQLNSVAAAPHNLFLMVGAEWGGAVLLLTFVILARFCVRGGKVVRAFVQSDKESRVNANFTIAAWMAFVALLLHSMVSNIAVIPTSQMAFLLATCLVATVPSERPIGCSLRPAFVGTLWTVVGIVLMAWVLVVDFPKLENRNSSYSECRSPTSFFSPRFWQQGWAIDGCPKSSKEAVPLS